jgi:hypothetical protein
MRKLTQFEDCVLYDVESEPGEVKHLSTQRKKEQLYIPEVAASERGTAQTCMRRALSVQTESARHV